MNGERYTVTSIGGFLSCNSHRNPGVSYMVIDTLWNRRIMATYRSEDYTRAGRLWARLGAETECDERNAAMRVPAGYGDTR